MTTLYRCDECGKETESPIRLEVMDRYWSVHKCLDACGPDDAIRLSAPIIREGLRFLRIYKFNPGEE